MSLDAFRAAVLEVARASMTKDGFSDSMPAKIAALMVRHLGGVDIKVVCETGSAYLFVYGLKVRVSNHRRGVRFADVEVKLGTRGDDAGCLFAVNQAAQAMQRLLDARDRLDGQWLGLRHG